MILSSFGYCASTCPVPSTINMLPDGATKSLAIWPNQCRLMTPKMTATGLPSGPSCGNAAVMIGVLARVPSR